MSDLNAKGVKLDWVSAQNDTDFKPDNLIDLVKFLARCAAEKDHAEHCHTLNAPPTGKGGKDG